MYNRLSTNLSKGKNSLTLRTLALLAASFRTNCSSYQCYLVSPIATDQKTERQLYVCDVYLYIHLASLLLRSFVDMLCWIRTPRM
jgi:hypothetical protein